MRPLACATLGLIGLAMAHEPMLMSRLDRIQTDSGDTRSADTRFNQYLLEHHYRWITGQAQPGGLWNPPFFSPSPNALARSDLMLSVAIPYAVYRSLGLPTSRAFALWMITWSAVNFLLGYLLFRQGFGVGPLGTSAGAFLLAFGAPRLNQVGHPQLLPCGFAILAIYVLTRIFSNQCTSPARRGVLWSIFAVTIAAQLYGGFYLGWFLILALGLTLAWSLAMKPYRQLLFQTLRRDALMVVTSLLLAMLLLWPLTAHYLMTTRDGFRPDGALSASMIPTLRSWINVGPHDWIWGWTHETGIFRSLRMPHEHQLGVGPFTTLAAFAGFAAGWRYPAVRLVAFATLTLMLATTRFPSASYPAVLAALLWGLAAHTATGPTPGRRRLVALAFYLVPGLVLAGLIVRGCADHQTLWPALGDWIPGAPAIRAVARVGLLVLLPISLALALCIETVARRTRLGAIALLALCAAEQGVRTKSYDSLAEDRHIARLRTLVEPGHSAFYYVKIFRPIDFPGSSMMDIYACVANINVDAMWLQLAQGMPTLNGYSGSTPRDYPLYHTALRSEGNVRVVRSAVGRWLAGQAALHPEDVTIVVDPPGTPPRPEPAFWPR